MFCQHDPGVRGSGQRRGALQFVMPDSPRAFLEGLYRSALRTIQPTRAVSESLGTLQLPPGSAVHLLAIGKAARPMASAAVAWCSGNAVTVRGGVCISHDDDNSPVASLRVLSGDHPIPGVNSQLASDALDEYLGTSVHHGDRVLVLLSGGTSALIGAPRREVSPGDYVACCQALLGSGLAIGPMNLLRRRLSRWGGGMMAAAFNTRGARADVLAISDVPADELAAIGGGPCIADATETPDLLEVMANAVLNDADAELLRRTLAAVAQTVPGSTRRLITTSSAVTGRRATPSSVRRAQAESRRPTSTCLSPVTRTHAGGRSRTRC